MPEAVITVSRSPVFVFLFNEEPRLNTGPVLMRTAFSHLEVQDFDSVPGLFGEHYARPEVLQEHCLLLGTLKRRGLCRKSDAAVIQSHIFCAVSDQGGLHPRECRP